MAPEPAGSVRAPRVRVKLLGQGHGDGARKRLGRQREELCGAKTRRNPHTISQHKNRGVS